MHLGLSLALTAPRGGSAVSYGAEATALFARMSVQPDATRKGLINTCINSLVADGVWAKLQGLWVFQGATQADTLLNWISTSHTATLGGTLASGDYTTDRGYLADGIGDYIDLNLNDNTTSLDNVSFGVWVNQDNGSDNFAIGTTSGSTTVRLAPQNAAGNAIARVHSTAGPSGAVAGRTGLTGAERTAAGADAVYKNGSSLGTSATASTAVTAATYTLFRSGGSYTNDSIIVAYVGQSLGALNSNLYSALNTFLTAIGGT